MSVGQASLLFAPLAARLLGAALLIVGIPVFLAEIGFRRHWRHRRLVAIVVPVAVVSATTLAMDLAEGSPFILASDVGGIAAYLVGAVIPLAAMSLVFERYAAAATRWRLSATLVAGIVGAIVALPLQLFASCVFGAGCV